MPRTKLFRATLILLAMALLSLVVALAVNTNEGAASLSIFFVVLTVLFAGSAVMIALTRQEKQKLRSNGYSQRIQQRQHEIKKDIGDVSENLNNFEEKINESFEGLSTQIVSVEQAISKLSLSSESINPQQEIRPLKTSAPLNRVYETNTPVDSYVETYELKLDVDSPNHTLFQLGQKNLQFSVPLANNHEITLHLSLAKTVLRNDARAAVISFKAFDKNDEEIRHPLLPSYSNAIGYFSYLATADEMVESTIIVSVPRSATKLEANVRAWGSYPQIKNLVCVKTEGTPNTWYETRDSSKIKVASILDEFSYNSFKYECNLISLTPQTWRAQMDAFQPDLFFCESAWSGADSNTRPWMGRVYASENFNYENRQALLDILDYCQERGIPTVFWNKEDPTHYSDKKHNFVDTAIKFDHIFTTAVECVQMYKEDYGHTSVNVLPFATQPRMFNPVISSNRSTELVFAGGWYGNHENRSEAMKTMFDAALASGKGLKIYDRFYGSTDETKKFPSKYQPYLNPPVPNDRVAEVYKESEIGMTINTVTDSKTMFARRIFELMSCNTLVVSNTSVGVKDFFGDDVLYLDQNPGILSLIDSVTISEMRKRNLENVLKNHTYKKRFEKILETAGVPFNQISDSGAFMVRLTDKNQGEAVFKKMQSMRDWEGPKTILVAANLSDLDYAEALAQWNTHNIRVVSEQMLIEDKIMLNQAFGAFSRAILVDGQEFLSSRQEKDAYDNLFTHMSYMDLPIFDSSADSAHDTLQYRVNSVDSSRTLAVTPQNFLTVASAKKNNKKILAYAI